MSHASLARTVLAISSYRSDKAVLTLLAQAFADGGTPFGAVIVVDSLGSGRIGEEASARGWPIRYENADINLGSAGNLARRLQLAAATGLDWCLALNHDATLDVAKAEKLLACGSGTAKVGAVYPQLHLIGTDRYDRPRRDFTLFGLTDASPLGDRTLDVAWGSSNGALYALPAIRRLPDLWSSLWMGYEDLALGFELQRAGWRQLLCGAVTSDDNYEFAAHGAGALTVRVADKAAWYSYYQARNPLLIAKRSGWRALGRVQLMVRYLADLALIALVKTDKRLRFRLWLAGVRDGLAGKGDKSPVP